jgi:hypothetical protein
MRNYTLRCDINTKQILYNACKQLQTKRGLKLYATGLCDKKNTKGIFNYENYVQKWTSKLHKHNLQTLLASFYLS